MKVLILMGFFCMSVASTEGPARDMACANNKFTADVYQALIEKQTGNFVISPSSVKILLAIIHAGSIGNTAHEISNTIQLPEKREDIDALYKELQMKLQSSSAYTLQCANKIYVKEKYSLQEDYKKTTSAVFGAEIQNIDFTLANAVNEINEWVAQKTNNKIQKLVEADDVSEETRAILLNAIYFKGRWFSNFNKVNREPFYIAETSFILVDMMEQTNYFFYHRSTTLKAQFIWLPYKGDNITMTLVLPNTKEGLPALEKNIHSVVAEFENDYKLTNINLKVPKTKIESTTDFTPILKQLGIQDAFTSTADFHGMLTDSDGEPLYISKIVQKAIIETDEEGTVAAALTGGFATTVLMSEPAEPTNFHADHPFILFLKHKETGIFFIARYSIPEGQVCKTELNHV